MKTFSIVVRSEKDSNISKKFYLKSFSVDTRMTRENLQRVLSCVVKSGYTVKVRRCDNLKEYDFKPLPELLFDLSELRLYKTQRVFQMVGYNETKCGTLMVMPQGVLPIEGWYSEPNTFIKLKTASEYLKIDMQALANDLNKQDLGFNFKVWNGPTGTGKTWTAIYAAVYFIFMDKVYGLLQMCTLLSLPILRQYNGERGSWKGMKWLFYIYYPAHLFVIGIIRVMMGQKSIFP